jgi:hypothetical protein
MKISKNAKLSMFFIVGILLVMSFVSAEYMRTNFGQPNLGAFGIKDYSFDKSMCEAGQDFIIQITPFGCTPAVVRTDLLEEQNVPVFCQLGATKINPLIDVEAIDSISFTGEYPNEVSGIGFHPAKAALGVKGTLNSPVLNNIGYAVIVLKKQKNASAIPEFVQGNLTAKIKYNIKNAFGIGKARFYLPEMDYSEWEDKHIQYSFWNGKGYLRAEVIEADRAVISIYDDTKKISSVNLKKGETSRKIGIPGFDCLANLQLKLDGLEAPDTRAKLEINGEVVEVAEKEKFLENKCTVKKIEKQGLVQKVEIRCDTDEKRGDKFPLSISPSIILEINGIKENYSVGDKLYEFKDLTNKEKSIYLGYIGESDDGTKFIIPVVSPEYTSEAFKETLIYKQLPRAIIAVQYESGSFLFNVVKSYLTVGYGGLLGIFEFLRTGNYPVGWVWQEGSDKKSEGIEALSSFGDIPFLNIIAGNKIKFIGFTDPLDKEWTGDTKKSYEDAMKDYMTIVNSFSGEKESEDSQETFGERALFNAIQLAENMEQKKTVLELCKKFKEGYSKSVSKLECDDEYKLSSPGVLSRDIIINNRVKRISFEGIYEPSFKEYGAEINVRYPNGDSRPLKLVKNQIVYLYNEKFFSIDQGIWATEIYFKYVNDEWMWSSDKLNWMNVPNTKVIAGKDKGREPVEKNVELIKSLENKNFEEGKNLILIKGGKEKTSNEFIQLISLDEDSAKFKTGFFSGERELKKNIAENFGSEYIFTLTNVNLKKQAKVSVIPNIDNAGTEAKFSFKIGIEQRAIKLSPEKTLEKIKELNKTIKKWEKNSKQLGKVVQGLKGACLGVGAFLIVKDFFANTGGKAIARQNIMKGIWYPRCSNDTFLDDKNYKTSEECLVKESNNIDKDVDEYYKELKNQNDYIKDLQGDCESTKFLTETHIDTDCFGEIYLSDNYRDKLKENLNNKFGDEIKIDGENISIDDFVSGLNISRTSVTQLRSLQLNSRLGDSLDEMAKKNLIVDIKDIYINTKGEIERSSFERDTIGVKGAYADSYGTKDSIQGIYRGATATKDNPEVSDETPIQLITFNNEKYYLELEETKNNEYIIKDIYDEDWTLLNEENVNSVEIKRVLGKGFKKYDSFTYKNKYKDPKLRYYETEPYKGFPALVPFDENNGWYASIRQTLPVSGKIASYEESGRVMSFYLCNVGENGVEENRRGDDICEMINLGTGQPYNQFPGLDSGKALKLVRCAKNAIEDAQKQHKSGVTRVSISTNCGSVSINVGSPAVDVPEMKCQSFMSPKDCQLLFNVCDPVICPSSRCNFGGAYHVKDVVQSGIIGSILLCLPNFREGIYIPVCLTGIKAGIDGLLSVHHSYRDCLQENLDTGEMVGICDEIYSIYLCEFFWKQSLPLAKIIIPKMMEVLMGQNVRGGGEYLGVASAWENAEKSTNYFVQYYAKNSYEAFKAKIVEGVGDAICQNSISASYPEGGNLLDSLTEPDSPHQFHGRFDEIPFTSATVPAISQYKVYYHIYAGEELGAYYKVYLKSIGGDSFYQDISDRVVASGYIGKGGYASETKDFTAPSGYKQMCIMVNQNEECGFKQVSTSFAIDYVKDKYMKEQTEKKDIKTETECIAGSVSAYSLLTPNIQGAAEEMVNPAIYNRGIIRICATDNPGKGTDAYAGMEGSRWVNVGYCDDKRIKCWLDTESVKDVIQHQDIEDDVLEDHTRNQLEILRSEGNYFTKIEFELEIENIEELIADDSYILIINKINEEFLKKAFLNNEKAHLLLLRGNALGKLAKELGAKEDRSITPELKPSEEKEEPKEIEEVSEVSMDIGEQIWKIAKDYEKSEYDHLRIDQEGNEYSSLVCASFVTKVLNEVGASIETGLGKGDYIPYLTDKFKERKDFKLVNENELKIGDIVILGSKEKEKQHTSIFSHYSEDKSRLYVYGDPGSTDPVKLQSFPVKSDNWYFYEAYRYIWEEKVGLKIKNDCIESAEWVDKSFEKIDLKKDISPGTVYIKLEIKSMNSCKGYSLTIYNKEIFGTNEEFDIDDKNLKERGDNYYLPYEVNLIKKVLLNYDPNEYYFIIYDSKGSEIFVGDTITVDTIYAF